MRGVYTIERETTDGDRAIVEKIDPGAVTAGVDPLEIAKIAAHLALREPAVWAVRVYLDNGASYELRYRCDARLLESATQREP